MAGPTAQEETLQDEKATSMECIFVTTERGTPFDGCERGQRDWKFLGGENYLVVRNMRI